MFFKFLALNASTTPLDYVIGVKIIFPHIDQDSRPLLPIGGLDKLANSSTASLTV
jgi:hypothetical protein